MKAYYKSEDKNFTLLQGDCIELMSQFDFKFDMIFADPPYFLSNGGISVQSGRMVSVNTKEIGTSPVERMRTMRLIGNGLRHAERNLRAMEQSGLVGRTTIYSLLPRILQSWAIKYLTA